MTAVEATTVDAPVATLATVHRQLAAADLEGLPVPELAQVDPSDATLHLALRSVPDVRRWQRWFAAHGTGPMIVHIAEAQGWRRHQVAGPWRGWELTLAHVTRLAADGGEQL